MAKHGWSGADADDTREALATPVGIDPKYEGGSLVRATYVGPEYGGANGALCARVVVVAPTIVGSAGARDPVPKGIITSYGNKVN
jgi:hypothetical protein